MEFTHEQITEILTKIASEKDGFNKIMTVSFDAMMRAERSLHNEENKDMSNGFRPRRFFCLFIVALSVF